MNPEDDFSLADDNQTLASGFVISPQNESVSIITDEFDHSISSSSEDTPLAQIIGRFSFFSKVRKVASLQVASLMRFNGIILF